MISTRTIKTVILDIIRFFLSILIPVNKKKIIFQSSPDYSDNARALSDYLFEHSDYLLVWAVSDKSLFNNNTRIRFINNDDSKALLDRVIYVYHTISSKYLFSTHAAFQFANKRKQTYVCLWHGMPLKRIAALVDDKNKSYLSNASYIVSTSHFYVPIIAKCFNKKDNQILPLGYPRNDWLFQDTETLNKLEFSLNGDEKLILYLPTFRNPCGGGYSDSTADTFCSDIVNFKDTNHLEELNAYLEQMHLKMIIKPHPAESNKLTYTKLSNILIVPHSFFVKRDIQLNQIMKYANALITDFSGAYCDFLSLDRPIGFILSDFDEYKNNRGFVFDNILDYLAGYKIYTKDSFISFCSDVANGVDKFKEERAKMRLIFNDFTDNNCSRIAHYFDID